MLRALLGLATAVVVAACGPETKSVSAGQVLLFFDTDAPVLAAPDEAASHVVPLFDRLLVEIYAPAATAPCNGCTNEFELDTSLFRQKSVSIGVVPPIGAPGYVVRVRMFKEAFADPSGQPDPDSTVDMTVALPVVTTNTIAEATVQLATDDVGQPKGSLASPVQPTLGPPQQSKVGTWPGATPVDCPGVAPAGAVCVPGGAYWMGNPNSPGFNPGSYVPEPRLIVLSPFFMKATEVTVEELRAAGQAPKEIWSGSSAGSTSEDWCTFTAAPGAFEKEPVNCVTFVGARAYCNGKGGDLPTEAQYEYAATAYAGDIYGGGKEVPNYVWGGDEPTCTDAIYGRGGWGLLKDALDPCRPAVAPGSPAVAGSGARDHLDLPGGHLFDLAGNVAEVSRDVWNRIEADEPCWAHAGVYRDPWCTQVSPNDGPAVVYRGGNWGQVSNTMVASNRFSIASTVDNAQIGFRCVWAAP